MQIGTSQAAFYHEGKFPPKVIDYGRVLPSLLEATDALARYSLLAAAPNSPPSRSSTHLARKSLWTEPPSALKFLIPHSKN
jgi:hypothetical protein